MREERERMRMYALPKRTLLGEKTLYSQSGREGEGEESCTWEELLSEGGGWRERESETGKEGGREGGRTNDCIEGGFLYLLNE